MGCGPVRTGVTMTEGGRLHPGLEGLLVPPAGYHQPLGPAVGRAQQLESLEAVLPVHRPGPAGEPPGRSSPALPGTVMALILMTVMPTI